MFGGLQRWWAKHWRDLIFDGAPPFVLLILGVVDSVTGAFTEPIGTAPGVTALIPGALACLALLFRRYRPLLSLVVVLTVLAVPPLILPTSITYWDEFMVWVVALYSCGRHAKRPIAFIGLGVSAVAMFMLSVEFADIRAPGGILFNSALLIAGFSIGMLARSWAGYRERIVRIAADRAVAEERASRRERARIARELHDVIAHTITVIVMQAGGARLASAANPAIAAVTLAQIEELGRASLAELRTLLPLLRDGEGDEPAGHEPTLAKVAELCERMRGLGLPVRLRKEGGTDDVPSGLQLTTYRVVQEALTNVVRHSGMIDTEVRIIRRDRPDRLSIDVENRIPVGVSRVGNSSPSILGAGRGLKGLEERVRLVGGEFSVNASEGESFLLHVELPIKADHA